MNPATLRTEFAAEGAARCFSLTETFWNYTPRQKKKNARPHSVSCRTEERALMESEGTSSRCLHLSHPLTSLNEKWMDALRKLVRRYLTSMFPAPAVCSCACVCVCLVETLCVCVCVSTIWICIKPEKGRSESLTGGPAAIPAKPALQSTRCGLQPRSKVPWCPPSERVNDGPLLLLSRPGLD